MYDIMNQYQCSVPDFTDLKNKYAYYRINEGADVICDASLRPNIALQVFGRTSRKNKATCYEALQLWYQTCTQLGGTCAAGIDATIDANIRASYNCSADVATRLSKYQPALPGPAVFNDTAGAAACMSDYLCSTGGCTSVPLQLQQTYPDFPQCALSAAGRRLSHTGGAGRTEGETAYETYNRCNSEAYVACKYNAAVKECPGIVNQVRPKETPVSSALSPAQASQLGYLEYTPSQLGLASCQQQGATADCFTWLETIEPAARSAALGNFTQSPDQTELAASVSFPSFPCASGAGPGQRCDASSAQLNNLLYDAWYKSEKSWIDYTIPERQRNWNPQREGKYQLGAHFTQWDEDNLNFDMTLMYNGTFWPTVYQKTRSFYEVAAMSSRINAALYKSITRDSGAELFSRRQNLLDDVGVNLQVDRVSVTSFIGPILMPTVLSLLFPLMVLQLVAEKASKLREIMAMTGLKRTPFWILAYCWNLLLYLGQLVFVFIFS